MNLASAEEIEAVGGLSKSGLDALKVAGWILAILVAITLWNGSYRWAMGTLGFAGFMLSIAIESHMEQRNAAKKLAVEFGWYNLLDVEPPRGEFLIFYEPNADIHRGPKGNRYVSSTQAFDYDQDRTTLVNAGYTHWMRIPNRPSSFKDSQEKAINAEYEAWRSERERNK